MTVPVVLVSAGRRRSPATVPGYHTELPVGPLFCIVRGPRPHRRLLAHAAGLAYGPAFLSTRANGQLALGVYKLDAARNLYMPSCLEVFGLRGELISEVTSFRNPELIRVFGLPEKLRP